MVLREGALGAGKTTLSRGIVRGKFDDDTMIVTSPSYLLDNTYNYGPGEHIHHMDLYRLPVGYSNLGILGIPQIYDTAVCLIEWPDRLTHDTMPESYLDVLIDVIDEGVDVQAAILCDPPLRGLSAAQKAEILHGSLSNSNLESDIDSDKEDKEDKEEGYNVCGDDRTKRLITLRCVGERWISKAPELRRLLLPERDLNFHFPTSK